MVNYQPSSIRSYFLASLLISLACFLGLWIMPQDAAGRSNESSFAETLSQQGENNPQNDTEHFLYLPLTANAYCPPFVDDFSNTQSGWPVGENNDLIFGYLSGEYQIRSKRSGDFYLFPSPSCARVNHTVEVDTRWAGETGQIVGVMFALKDNFEQFYLFGINTENQTYVLEYWGPEGWVLLIQAKKSDAIRPGQATNHLKATRIGETILLEINDRVVDELADTRITGPGKTGLYTFPFRNRALSDARFDNFVSRHASPNN